MQTETQFKRKQRIGFNPLACGEDMPKIYVEVISTQVETFTKKDGDTIPFVDVINMQTGEEQKLWLSGQLNYQLNTVALKNKTLKGLKLEVNYEGQKTLEIEGEKVKVNQYSLFEIE